MNLENIKLKNDIYLTYWFSGLLPIYDSQKYLEKFLQSNFWVEFELKNYRKMYNLERLKYQLKEQQSFLQKVFEKMFSYRFFERFVQKIQLRIMPSILKNQMNKGDGVIINNNILKMHPYDRRKEFTKKFNLKIQETMYE